MENIDVPSVMIPSFYFGIGSVVLVLSGIDVIFDRDAILIA